jgi:hypothetical protein
VGSSVTKRNGTLLKIMNGSKCSLNFVWGGVNLFVRLHQCLLAFVACYVAYNFGVLGLAVLCVEVVPSFQYVLQLPSSGLKMEGGCSSTYRFHIGSKGIYVWNIIYSMERGHALIFCIL